MTKRNLIFLDFDGVLNSVRSVIAYGREICFEPQGIDPVALLLIKRLCEEAPAEIVISSTWRKLYTLDEFKKMFADKGWEEAPIIGITPVHDLTTLYGKHWGFRGNEVGYFLKQFVDSGNDLGTWVCIDDSRDFHVQKTKLGGFFSEQPCVFVNDLHGFSLRNFQEALARLNPKHELLTQLASQLINK